MSVILDFKLTTVVHLTLDTEYIEVWIFSILCRQILWGEFSTPVAKKIPVNMRWIRVHWPFVVFENGPSNSYKCKILSTASRNIVLYNYTWNWPYEVSRNWPTWVWAARWKNGQSVL